MDSINLHVSGEDVEEEEEEGSYLEPSEEVEVYDLHENMDMSEEFEDGTEHLDEEDTEEGPYAAARAERYGDEPSCILTRTNAVYAVDVTVPSDSHMIVVSSGIDDACTVSTVSIPGLEMQDVYCHKQFTDSGIAIETHSGQQRIAVGGMDGRVLVLDANTGSFLGITTEGPNEVSTLNWDHRGEKLLVGGADGTVWIYTVLKDSPCIVSIECTRVFSDHCAEVSSARFAYGKSGETWIVSAGKDGMLIVRDVQEETFQKGPPSWKHYLSAGKTKGFHPEGSQLISMALCDQIAFTGSQNGTLRAMHMGTGKLINPFGKEDASGLDLHTASIESIACSPTIPLFATGGLDSQVVIWDSSRLSFREQIHTLTEVTRVVWHPLHPFVAVGCVDGSIGLFDGRNGQSLRRWKGHQDVVMDLRISSCGNWIISGSEDGTVHLSSVR